MPLTEFKQGTHICSEGEPLSNLYFITKGSAQAQFNGRTFRFEQGSAIGLCGLNTGKYCQSYTAITDITALSFAYEDFFTLESLVRDNAEISNVLVSSMSRLLSEFLGWRAALKAEADSAYTAATKVYPEYERLCSLYALASKKLPGLPELVKASDSDPMEDWINNYYAAIRDLEPETGKSLFSKSPIAFGFLRRAAEDLYLAMQACGAYMDYLKQISAIYQSRDGHDLFALVSELHLNVANIKSADTAVEGLIMQLAKLMSKMTSIDIAAFQKRFGVYKSSRDAMRSGSAIDDNFSVQSGQTQNLSDSLEVILEYSGCGEDLCNNFTRCVHEFIKLPDKGSSDDTAFRLRKEIVGLFYDVYQHVFLKSLKDQQVPTIIKMFLNFGYVDATLAGLSNANFLYSIADSLKGNPKLGVYTITEWLKAIYKGKKDPSRDDFDTDYTAYIQEIKVTNRLTPAEEAQLLADNANKVRFELERVFPVVNKITFGRITTFCPLFSDYNVQRGLDVSLVTPALINETLAEIRKIDFSAFYRDTLYTTADGNLSKENVHLEILPDIILMPNVGTRGAMWQEIEGKKRTSPARLFLPVFLLVDLKTMLIRLTGEFRWEMCRRIQGPRWNDVTDPSLTSAFFDYLQFYRTNRELSLEVKSSIKTELARARNTYKAVFVSNYSDWLLYESNGSPRLNKFVRNILAEYCPFSAEIREKLAQNPLYSEALKKYNFKQQQIIKKLSNTIQKISKESKTGVAKELLDELEYLKK